MFHSLPGNVLSKMVTTVDMPLGKFHQQDNFGIDGSLGITKRSDIPRFISCSRPQNKYDLQYKCKQDAEWL